METPGLITTTSKPIAEKKNVKKKGKNFEFLNQECTCPVCLDLFVEPVTLTCGHSLCQDCIGGSYNDMRCPTCREEIAHGIKPNKILQNLLIQYGGKKYDKLVKNKKVIKEIEQTLNNYRRSGYYNCLQKDILRGLKKYTSILYSELIETKVSNNVQLDELEFRYVLNQLHQQNKIVIQDEEIILHELLISYISTHTDLPPKVICRLMALTNSKLEMVAIKFPEKSKTNKKIVNFSLMTRKN